jgi:ubiquitin-protein ligase
MIDFSCPSCGKRFSVDDALAGRRAKCKGCGGAITVPAPAAATPARPPVRVRRLMADAEQLRAAFPKGGVIELLDAAGEPPEKYRLRYHVGGLVPGKSDDTPLAAERHDVEIDLPADYPRIAPLCRMLTPSFHPNIDTSSICVGDHWAAGERLVDLCVRIGEMLAYQAYNIRSPLNAKAAMWADLNPQRLPTDPRDLRTTNV